MKTSTLLFSTILFSLAFRACGNPVTHSFERNFAGNFVPLEGSKNVVQDTLKLHKSAQLYVVEELSKPTAVLGTTHTVEIFEHLKAAQIEQISPMPDSLVFFANHPFLLGMLRAYQEHRPIAISPDIIWLLIEQGFARHIASDPEKFRSQLVDFAEKKELTVVIDTSLIQLGNPTSKWEMVFPQFATQIANYTGEKFVNQLRADFTTSTDASRIASEVVLMETVKAYFTYKVMMIGCGLPSVTIEGTVQDWERVLEKVDFISTYDLTWWTDELRPIIQKIIATKKGEMDQQFWMSMVKVHTKAIYATTETIDGWITKFYPFNDKGQRRNLEAIKYVNSIAPEYVKVPFTAVDAVQNIAYKMEFWAGLFGLEQDTRNFLLKPCIGWAVVHADNRDGVTTAPQQNYDDVSLGNITEIPAPFFGLRKINRLRIDFIGAIQIPDEISKMTIRNLWVTGDISTAGKARLQKLLPETSIFVNNILLPQGMAKQ